MANRFGFEKDIGWFSHTLPGKSNGGQLPVEKRPVALSNRGWRVEVSVLLATERVQEWDGAMGSTQAVEPFLQLSQS